ncbi:MAG: spermidine synthase [Gammaproteobacteria bacterium]
MIPWELLDSAPVPGGDGMLHLYRRGDEFSIRIGRNELMNSRTHGSEDRLAEAACAQIAGRAGPHVLIGGLGMGFTLAASLRMLGPDAVVVAAELVPAVVRWNRGPLGEHSGRPLDDARVGVHEGDVAGLLRARAAKYDAVLLDVDNGPAGLTHKGNDWLYGADGLRAAQGALRPGGVLAVWSAAPDRAFHTRLRRAGFTVEELRVRAHRGRGARHIVWLARK